MAWSLAECSRCGVLGYRPPDVNLCGTCHSDTRQSDFSRHMCQRIHRPGERPLTWLEGEVDESFLPLGADWPEEPAPYFWSDVE